MACLKHPHIMQVLGYSVNQRGFFYHLMELMATDLRTYMDEILGSEDRTQMSRMSSGEDQGPFKLAVALDIMLQVAEALNYMHKNRMVHRDVKSSNILVSPMQSPEGYLVVKGAEFGLSKFSTTSHQIINVGTTRYMALRCLA